MRVQNAVKANPARARTRPREAVGRRVLHSAGAFAPGAPGCRDSPCDAGRGHALAFAAGWIGRSGAACAGRSGSGSSRRCRGGALTWHAMGELIRGPQHSSNRRRPNDGALHKWAGTSAGRASGTGACRARRRPCDTTFALVAEQAARAGAPHDERRHGRAPGQVFDLAGVADYRRGRQGAAVPVWTRPVLCAGSYWRGERTRIATGGSFARVQELVELGARQIVACRRAGPAGPHAAGSWARAVRRTLR